MDPVQYYLLLYNNAQKLLFILSPPCNNVEVSHYIPTRIVSCVMERVVISPAERKSIIAYN